MNTTTNNNNIGTPVSAGTSQNGSVFSDHASPQDAALSVCRTFVAELGDLTRAWNRVVHEQGASQEARQAAFAAIKAAQENLSQCRELWKVQFPLVPELTGEPVPVSHQQPVAPEFDYDRVKLPKDIPYLNTRTTKHSNPEAKQVYASAQQWAIAFETVIGYAGLSKHLDKLWPRLLLRALDAAQREQLEQELVQNPTKEGEQTHSWAVVQKTIVNLFDTATEEYRLIVEVLNCYQGDRESINHYLQRFIKAVYSAKLESDHPLISALLLENMTPESHRVVTSFLAKNFGTEWPKDIRELNKHMASLPTPNTSGTKRPHEAQPLNRASRFKRNKDSFSNGKGRPQKLVTNPCKHCLKKGIAVQFSSQHSCPNYKSPASISKNKPQIAPNERKEGREWANRMATLVFQQSNAAEEENDEAGAPTDDDEEMAEALTLLQQ